MIDSKNEYQVPAVVRAVAVLDYLGHRSEASFTTIHKDLGLPKSSALALLRTLVDQGILRVSSNGVYTLGLRLFELGTLAVRRMDIRKEALPHMRALVDKVRLTCHLGVLDGAESVYLVKVECDQALVVNSWEGKRVSLHSSGLGKSLLIVADRDMSEKLIAEMPMERRTKKTITSRDEFIKHLEEARRKGWTIDDEEEVEGIRCIGVPVFGLEKLPLSLSIAGPIAQLPYHRLEELAGYIMNTARELEKSLGLTNSVRGLR
jgi:DNA-binding IclR family transcriptional regulator